MQAVRAAGLVKTFGSVVAVNDLSFEAKAGEFLTLLGPLMMTAIVLVVVVLVHRLVQGNVRATTMA